MKPEWRICKAEDFIEFNPRLTIKRGEVATKISMDKLMPFTKTIPSVEQAVFSGGSKFTNGDTIMARITPCLENGKTAFVKDLQDGEVAFGSTEFIVLRAKPGISDPQFIYYLATSPFFRNIAIKSMIGSSGRQRVQQTVLNELEVLIPPLDEQRQIGTFLARLDDKIELNQKINCNLEQQAQAIFKSWFVNYEPFNGVKPSEWEEMTLDTLSSLISRGITPKYSEHSEQIVINQKCIRNHIIDLSLARSHVPKKINEKWIQFGDLLINSTGEGTLGRVAQVWFKPNNMTVDSHITIVRPVSAKLIYYIGLWGVLHEKEIEALHIGSTGQTELPRDRVKEMKLLLPDDKILKRFNAILTPMISAIVSNQEESERLSFLRDALLPKLISGEIDVSDIQI